MDKNKKEKKEYKLQDAVAQQFELVDTDQVVGFFPKWGEVDMTQLNVAGADALVKKGFPFLKRKEQKPAKKPE